MLLSEFLSSVQRSLPENLPRRASADLRLMREQFRSVYQSAMNKHPWSFLHSWVNDQLPASYTTGTISVTKASATVTGSGTSWTASHVGYYLLTGDSVPVRVNAVGGGTSLTLETAWGEANATGLSYRLVSLLREPLSISNVAAILGVWSKDGRMQEKSVMYLDSIDPKRGSGTGTPWAFSTRGFGSKGPIYEIYPYPDAGAMLRILLLKKPTIPSLMADEVVFNNHSVLELGVRAAIFAYAFAEAGDERLSLMAVGLDQQYNKALEALIEEDRVSTSWLSSVPTVEGDDRYTRLDPMKYDTMPW